MNRGLKWRVVYSFLCVAIVLLAGIAALPLQRVTTPAAIPSTKQDDARVVSLLTRVVTSQRSAAASRLDAQAKPSNESVVTRYRRMATCARYEEMRGIGESLRSDPYSWFNYEPARAELSEDTLNSIEESLAFVEKQAQLCEPMPPRSLETVVAIYTSALAAADIGDAKAAECFVTARWRTDFGDDFPPAQLRELYAANVHRVIETQLQAGNWDIVEFLASAHMPRKHGLVQFVFPDDAVKSYRYWKLIALSAKGDQLERVTSFLSHLESKTTPEERATQAKLAAETHAKQFLGRPYVRDDLLCDQ